MEITGVLQAGREGDYDVLYRPNIVYAQRATGALALQLLLPDGEGETPGVFPLLVGVQGSGWRGVTGYDYVPRLAAFARHGYAVASIAYRGVEKDRAPFPAAVEDVRDAVRFLVENAPEYGIDPLRIALLGGSSGGQTVATAALMPQSEAYPFAVRACLLLYAPVDMEALVSDRIAENKPLRPGEGKFPYELHELFGREPLENPAALLRSAGPIHRIARGQPLPPFLFLQGDEDEWIPMAQGIRFCQRVREYGGRADFYQVKGARHVKGCWSPQAMALMMRFLDETCRETPLP